MSMSESHLNIKNYLYDDIYLASTCVSLCTDVMPPDNLTVMRFHEAAYSHCT